MIKLTRQQISNMKSEAQTGFEKALEPFKKVPLGRGGLSKKTFADLTAGHSDGLANMMRQLVIAGLVEIEE
jgi:hypothetical protein